MTKPKRYIIFFFFTLAGALLIIFFCRCDDHNSSSPKNPHHFIKQGVEYIDWYNLKINRIINSTGLKQTLYNVLGKPDSIYKMSNDCEAYYFKAPDKIVYIKGSTFELYKDSAAIDLLDFQHSNLNVVAGHLKLDSNTMLSELSKTFPVAVSRKYNVDNGNVKLTAIILGTDKDYKLGDTDGVWILLFREGKLVRMEYHLDC